MMWGLKWRAAPPPVVMQDCDERRLVNVVASAKATVDEMLAKAAGTSTDLRDDLLDLRLILAQGVPDGGRR